jgi:hypothetical protein
MHYANLSSSEKKIILGDLSYDNILDELHLNSNIPLRTNTILQYFCYLNNEANKNNSKKIYFYCEPISIRNKLEYTKNFKDDLLQFNCVNFLYIDRSCQFCLLYVDFDNEEIALQRVVEYDEDCENKIENEEIMNYVADYINILQEKTHKEKTNFDLTDDITDILFKNAPASDIENFGLCVCIMA